METKSYATPKIIYDFIDNYNFENNTRFVVQSKIYNQGFTESLEINCSEYEDDFNNEITYPKETPDSQIKLLAAIHNNLKELNLADRPDGRELKISTKDGYFKSDFIIYYKFSATYDKTIVYNAQLYAFVDDFDDKLIELFNCDMPINYIKLIK